MNNLFNHLIKPGKRLLRLPRLLRALAGSTLLGGLAACSPLSIINTLTPEGASTVTSDIAYGSDVRQKLDIYTPLAKGKPDDVAMSASAQAPVIVFFYGGNWSSGERADYAFVGRALASRGIVAVIADYRLYPQVAYPDFLDDSAQAVAWSIRHVAEHGGDPKRLFVMGHSAGAYNAAMIALDPRWLAKQGVAQSNNAPPVMRGWIGLAGPYNFIPIENKHTRLVFPYPQTPLESQPINHLSALTPPALLIAANDDQLVNPQSNTGVLALAMRKQGVLVVERYFDRVGHATLVASLSVPLRKLAPTLDEITQFVFSDGGRSSLATPRSLQESVAAQ